MPANFDLLDKTLAKEKERAKAQTKVPEILENIDLEALVSHISKVPSDGKFGETVGELMAKALGKDVTREHYFALKNYLVAIKMFGSSTVPEVEIYFNRFRISQGWDSLLPDGDTTALDMWTEAKSKKG